MAGLAMRATARRWRGLGVGVRLGCGFGRWPGGLRQQENMPEVAQRLARSMPQAVIADLVEAGRQDVLEEAPDELVAGHGLDVLDVWYARIEDSDVMAMLPQKYKAQLEKRIAKATAAGSHELAFPKLAGHAFGRPRIRDMPPIIFHPDPSRPGNMDIIQASVPQYRETLAPDVRILLDRYRLADAAIKVVGIGSVGTLCLVVLMISSANSPLFLQVKQANASVLEAFAGKSAYPHHGQRVIMGQQLMQPASDMFLGWATGTSGRQYYVRQLRDVKLPPLVETYNAEMLSIYGQLCGWALARAHAKAGDPSLIGGYLGKSAQFDEGMGKFALAYADQAERDHALLRAAVRSGAVEVQLED